MEFAGAFGDSFQGIVGELAAGAIKRDDATFHAGYFVIAELGPVFAIGATGVDIFAK